MAAAPPLELRLASPSGAAARRCQAAYHRELAARLREGFDPRRAKPTPPREMSPPRGYFLLASVSGRVVGCGGLRRLAGRAGEVKRMWTAPKARRRGVARALLRELESLARAAGMEALRLDTNRALIPALTLYRREGYRPIQPYNRNPYAQHWLEKKLRA